MHFSQQCYFSAFIPSFIHSKLFAEQMLGILLGNHSNGLRDANQVIRDQMTFTGPGKERQGRESPEQVSKLQWIEMKILMLEFA